MNIQSLNFVPYEEELLALSWEWLNDPEVKKLTDTPDITREGQLKWFKSLEGRADYKVWGLKLAAQYIGVMGLKGITTEQAEYFGYIGEKSFWGKGLSSQILNQAVLESGKLNLKSLWLKVLEDNLRAIKAYEKFGFIVSDRKDKFVFMKLDL